MSHEQTDEPLDRESERLLHRFAPLAARLDRDRILYLAGQASVEIPAAVTPAAVAPAAIAPAPRNRIAWFWPASTAAMTCVSAALMLVLLSRPAPVERIVVRDRIVAPPAPSAAVAPIAASVPKKRSDDLSPTENPLLVAIERIAKSSSPDSYLRARNLALAQGLDAWEPPVQHGGGGPVGPSSYRDLREQLLPQQSAARAASRASFWPQGLFDEVSM